MRARSDLSKRVSRLEVKTHPQCASVHVDLSGMLPAQISRILGVPSWTDLPTQDLADLLDAPRIEIHG